MNAEHDTEIGFWRRYVFSTDHKVIGIQYAITGLVFMLFGFFLIMVLRWQLAYPLKALPLIGGLFGEGAMPKGVMLPEFYNSLVAMHGTIMVFLGFVPLAVGGFGNYLVPLQIGAPDMALPRINMASYWSLAVGGVVMFISFFVPGGAANSGWTAYPPLADIATVGQTLWLLGMVAIILSSLLSSINFIVTIVQLRAKGLTMFRLPFFVWAQFVTAFILLLAMPPLATAGIFQVMDRLAGTSFFMPEGLVLSGEPSPWVGGGSPLLWQHLFWFLGHPEVYVMILPAMGIAAEVIASNTRRPLFGYRAMVYSTLFVGFLSFIVWAHHMYLAGMGTVLSTFFQTTTMIISLPSVVIIVALVLSFWGASVRFTVPMLFAIAFLPMFAIGGLTGLPLGLGASDIHLHDTYYVVGHFHYVIAVGGTFGLFAGIYHWFPKVTGRMMNVAMGKLHFWLTLVFMSGIFFPMLFQGFAGLSRRLYDQTVYTYGEAVQGLTITSSWAAWLLGLAQIPFIINFFMSIRKGQKVSENPWEATTLEWAAPSPPPHGNFTAMPVVHRSAYEYSVPGMAKDFLPQHVAAEA